MQLVRILVGGASDVPSSLGRVVAVQGMGAVLGYPPNVQWAVLADNVETHARHPEAGPLGTWRPQGPGMDGRKLSDAVRAGCVS